MTRALLVAALALLALPASAAADDDALRALDGKLRAKVLRETPGLEKALHKKHRYDAARLVLRWVAPRTPGAGGERQLDPQFAGAGDMYFNYFKPATKGVFCGGASVFYSRVLALFGIPSVTMDFGRLDADTHVTVLVPLRGNDKDWVVLDPTYNMEIVSRRTGKPVPIYKAMHLAAHRRANKVLRPRVASLRKRKNIRADGSVVTCGAGKLRTGMCGFHFIREEAAWSAYGYADGIQGWLSLYGEGELFNEVPWEIWRGREDFRWYRENNPQ